MRKNIWGVLVIAGTALAVSACATDDKMEAKMDWGMYQVGDNRSGYTYATAETRAMQDDDFVNPAMLWVDDGDVLWNTVDGTEGKSCATCHKDASDGMKGVATVYPKFDKKLGKIKSLESQFNVCRTERMKAKAWKWESHEMLSMTAFVRNQSRGMIVNVAVDGPAAPFFEKGKEFYNKRRGQLGMACSNCHSDYAGGQIRANILTQGQSNGFPTYRLKWQKPGSIHRRFRGCNKTVRSTPFGYGSDEYMNLELFVAWRGNGLMVETPAVRN